MDRETDQTVRQDPDYLVLCLDKTLGQSSFSLVEAEPIDPGFLLSQATSPVDMVTVQFLSLKGLPLEK